MTEQKSIVAGTLESSDVMVQILPNDSGNQITINSVVKNQFEKQIMNTVNQMIEAYDMQNIQLIIDDQGAVDIVLRARLETGFRRYGDLNE